MKYIGYYDIPKQKHVRRNCVLSAVHKMNYIADSLISLGYNVNFISASASVERKMARNEVLQIGDNKILRLFFSIGNANIFFKKVNALLVRVLLFIYLLVTVRKGETIIVYHSLGYINLIRLLKRMKKNRLILEVEEIYSDVSNDSKSRKKEFELFRIADAFLFSTDLLQNKVNIYNKPYAVLYGVYHTEPLVNNNLFRNNGLIHIVYAGTFDKRKGGIDTAIAISHYLSSKYHVHIIGFGSNSEITAVKKEIALAEKVAECKISYDGLLSGKEYINFLQNCHIGLSCQNPNGVYNETSFPSKILSYLSNGLSVVSIYLKVLDTPDLRPLINFYSQNTPQSVAETIDSIKLTDKDKIKRSLQSLEEKFLVDLKKIL